MSESLTLYAIETTLLDLMNERQGLETDNSLSPSERQSCLAVVDDQIKEYLNREVAKVDGVAAYIRECQARADNLESEANRIRDRAKAWAEKGKRLEGMVLSIMAQTGKLRLDGRNSTFHLRSNPPVVEIAQPELLPIEYMRETVTVSPDKVKIGQALKRGDSVPGCRFKHSERLEIK